jgi:hypothetical protein
VKHLPEKINTITTAGKMGTYPGLYTGAMRNENIEVTPV